MCSSAATPMPSPSSPLISPRAKSGMSLGASYWPRMIAWKLLPSIRIGTLTTR